MQENVKICTSLAAFDPSSFAELYLFATIMKCNALLLNTVVFMLQESAALCRFAVCQQVKMHSDLYLFIVYLQPVPELYDGSQQASGSREPSFGIASPVPA